jgi:hypothetical protein
MPDPSRASNVLELLELLDQMIEQQRRKVLEVARRFSPRVTLEDLLNPHDFPELQEAAEFHYEDGILAGYLAAQAAIRARVRSGS